MKQLIAEENIHEWSLKYSQILDWTEDLQSYPE